MLCNSLTKSERTMNIEYYSLIFYMFLSFALCFVGVKSGKTAKLKNLPSGKLAET